MSSSAAPLPSERGWAAATSARRPPSRQAAGPRARTRRRAQLGPALGARARNFSQRPVPCRAPSSGAGALRCSARLCPGKVEMAGGRSPGVWRRRRFGLLLLLAAAAGLGGGVSAAKSPSCHEVRTAFQIRQIGPLKLVPDVPIAESDLQICQHRAPTCCTKKMEESYQTAVRRERTQTIQALNFELKYMIVGHITAFQEAFESLLRFAENHTTTLFESAYRAMAKEAAEPIKELFTDLSLYILGAETTVENAVLRFFDSLFPLVYSRLINPGMTDLSEEYTECLRLTRQDINPFGRYSKEVVTELSKSLWASRKLNQALNMGIEVINTTEHAALTKECSKALVKMQYCPHCQGLTLIRPCVGYCLNVMRGCLASVSELDIQWREYISTLEYLTNEMAGSHDLELALLGIRNLINEAILHAQLNGPQLSATVDKVCGQPQEREGKPSADNIVQAKDVFDTQALTMAHSANLNNKRREFINYMKRSRTFYASVAERLCDGDLVMRDSSTCWNGEDVVESYTSRVVSNGLKAQINNPELKVKGLDPLISHLIDKLHHFNQLDTEKTKLKSERWASRESGSGGGRSEAMESSGDCDDEDGCQGSGDRIHTTGLWHARRTAGGGISPRGEERQLPCATGGVSQPWGRHEREWEVSSRAGTHRREGSAPGQVRVGVSPYCRRGESCPEEARAGFPLGGWEESWEEAGTGDSLLSLAPCSPTPYSLPLAPSSHSPATEPCPHSRPQPQNSVTSGNLSPAAETCPHWHSVPCCGTLFPRLPERCSLSPAPSCRTLSPLAPCPLPKHPLAPFPSTMSPAPTNTVGATLVKLDPGGESFFASHLCGPN
ncbi:glypican-5-like isoform X2 [Pelodiscus sinensis]|uniref:glypican-5-like isoform X2 n=1 Tax=Pelodiscus sinensis TaxID=13735 RepID=UPI003F6B2EDD